jgi:enamine deaminase RidA (YjgF/YER057c/UK114 family)
LCMVWFGGRAACSRDPLLCVLALLRQRPGSLDRMKRISGMTVWSATDFTQQSEVTDAASELCFRIALQSCASDLFYAIFSTARAHTRTLAGVYQLPKDAAVELEMITAIHPV